MEGMPIVSIWPEVPEGQGGQKPGMGVYQTSIRPVQGSSEETGLLTRDAWASSVSWVLLYL